MTITKGIMRTISGRLCGIGKSAQVLLGLAILISASAGAQTLASFQSGNKPVTIERFDPATPGEHAAVVVAHGAGGPEAGWRKTGLIEALTSAGYSVFAPHYFEAGGPWDDSGAGEKFYAYIRALHDATRYVGTLSGIRKGGIALVGYSLGGILVLAEAEESNSHPAPQPGPPIRVVVENYSYMPEFAAARMTTMPPVLLLHGEKDEVIPVAKAYETDKLLSSKAVPHEIQVYPGQGHGFHGDDLKDANRRTVEFIRKYLK